MRLAGCPLGESFTRGRLGGILVGQVVGHERIVRRYVQPLDPLALAELLLEEEFDLDFDDDLSDEELELELELPELEPESDLLELERFDLPLALPSLEFDLEELEFEEPLPLALAELELPSLPELPDLPESEDLPDEEELELPFRAELADLPLSPAESPSLLAEFPLAELALLPAAELPALSPLLAALLRGVRRPGLAGAPDRCI